MVLGCLQGPQKHILKKCEEHVSTFVGGPHCVDPRSYDDYLVSMFYLVVVLISKTNVEKCKNTGYIY